jgi:hypothetical protein
MGAEVPKGILDLDLLYASTQESMSGGRIVDDIRHGAVVIRIWLYQKPRSCGDLELAQFVVRRALPTHKLECHGVSSKGSTLTG